MYDNNCLIDGFGPVPMVRPETVVELGEVVRQSVTERTALYPVGGQTMLNLGTPPTTKGRAVDLRGLSKVIDFPARDMTITVEAGITLAQLRTILANENLRLPVDVPRAEQATLGGTLAANTSGSRRYGFGTLRDYVIGISAINDAGKEFKAGGRVVKNVAGYDLCKLLVGSLGTLGIISQVTLKLRPGAEEQALVILPCPDGDLESFLAKLHGSRTRPVCLDLLNRSAAEEIMRQAKMAGPEGEWTFIIGFEGNGDAVKWQVQQLIREIGGSLEARIGFTAEPLWQALTEWSLWPGSNLSFKATMLPSALARFCHAISGPTESVLLRAHAGNGIVQGHFVGQASNLSAALLDKWRDQARMGQGSVVVQRCPPAGKAALSVWGPASQDAWLIREIKNKFDPNRIFNPGRFVDGI